MGCRAIQRNVDHDIRVMLTRSTISGRASFRCRNSRGYSDGFQSPAAPLYPLPWPRKEPAEFTFTPDSTSCGAPAIPARRSSSKPSTLCSAPAKTEGHSRAHRLRPILLGFTTAAARITRSRSVNGAFRRYDGLLNEIPAKKTGKALRLCTRPRTTTTFPTGFSRRSASTINRSSRARRPASCGRSASGRLRISASSSIRTSRSPHRLLSTTRPVSGSQNARVWRFQAAAHGLRTYWAIDKKSATEIVTSNPEALEPPLRHHLRRLPASSSSPTILRGLSVSLARSSS